MIYLEDGIRVLRHVEKIVEPLGAHAALTGGVIFRGQSEKDIDIIIYPHQVSAPYNKQLILLELLRHNKSVETALESDDIMDVLTSMSTVLSGSSAEVWPKEGDVYQCRKKYPNATQTRCYHDKDVVIIRIDNIRVDLFFL